MDAALVGRWIVADPDYDDPHVLDIKRRGRRYEVEVTEEDGERNALGIGSAVLAGNRRYLSIELASPFSGYLNILYETFPPETLTLTTLTPEIGADLSRVAFQAYIREHAADPELYDEPLRYRREAY